MKRRRMTLAGLTLGAVLLIAMPDAALAQVGGSGTDDITFNVPVRLSRLSPEVTRGKVLCSVRVWYTGRVAAVGDPAGREDQDTAVDATSETPFSPSGGAFSGTVTVKIKIGPPRVMLDSGSPIRVGSGDYGCMMRLATASSDWYPSYLVQRSPAGVPTYSATGMLPPWMQDPLPRAATGAIRPR